MLSKNDLSGLFEHPVATAGKRGSKQADLVIFLDLDGTMKTTHERHGKLQFSMNDKTYRFDKRPGTDTFVKNCLKLAPTYVYTASSLRFAKNCLKLMGIYDEIDGLFTREDMQSNSLLDCSSFILVENDEYIGKIKIECMNKFSQNRFVINKNCWLVLVPDYVGGEEPGNVLQKAFAEVSAIAQKQGKKP